VREDERTLEAGSRSVSYTTRASRARTPRMATGTR